MGYSDDGVTQGALDEYYAHDSKYADLAIYASVTDAAQIASEAPWERERSESLMRFAEPHMRRDGVILDVGCSTGTALSILRDQGYQILGGIDPLATAVVVAREARGLNVIEGRFGTPHPNGRSDVVIISHVLEHVLDVRDAIASTAAAMTLGGHVVIEVPDASRFADHVYAPLQDFNTEHINHFSLSHLNALMASQGFRALELEHALVKSGPHHVYPVARGVWLYEGVAVDPLTIADHSGAHHAALVRYVDVSAALFETIDERVSSGLGADNFVLWGAGQFAMKLMKRDVFPMGQCLGIVDSSPSRIGLSLAGMRVMSPDAAAAMHPTVILPGSVFGAESIQRTVDALGMNARVIQLAG